MRICDAKDWKVDYMNDYMNVIKVKIDRVKLLVIFIFLLSSIISVTESIIFRK